MRAGTKGVIAAGSIAALGLVAACLESGSLAQAAAAGCETTADCFTGQECSGGACVEAAGGAGGGGGASVDPTECESSDGCLGDATFGAVPDIFWVGGTVEAPGVCTTGEDCAQGAGCRLSTVCAARPQDAKLPGLVRCQTGDECLSGRCLQGLDVKFCFRACSSDGDCPALAATSPAGTVFRCGELELVELPGKSVRACLPTDEAPGRTLCRTGADCRAGRDVDDGTSCRFVGTPWPLEAVPVCEAPLPALEAVATGLLCPEDAAATCEGGGCSAACKPSGNASQPYGQFCRGENGTPSRCTAPCSRDADCPERLGCSFGTFEERIGGWTAPPHSSLAGQAGRELRYCQLPKEGCYDELECGPDPLGSPGLGWSTEERRCSVQVTEQGKLFTFCVVPPAGTSSPGTPCASDAACDSNLCVDGSCTVPCDPDPARDRCDFPEMGLRLPLLPPTVCTEVPATPDRPSLRACLPPP